MPKFANLEDAAKFLNRNEPELKVGMVIRAFVQDTNPPKIKRFIIVGISENNICLGTVFLNTEINIDALPPINQKFQYKLVKTDERDFIDYDCYVDCSDLKERSYSEIHNLIVQNPKSVIGILSEKDLMNIHFTVCEAPTIAPKLKKKYNII